MGKLEELVLELTDWCPFWCLHCSSSSSPHCSNHLPADVVDRLISEAAALGARKISFGGGEPTSSPLLVPALRLTAKLGMSAEVFTCGTTGRGPLPPDLIGEFHTIPSLKLIFSVHGPDGQTHDKVTTEAGSFGSMLASLQACRRAGLVCEMNFVPLLLNVPVFDKVLALVEEIGIGRLSILRFVAQGRGADNSAMLQLNADQEKAFISWVQDLRAKASVEIRTGSPFNGLIPGNDVPCRAGGPKLVIQADGNVLPCEVFKHSARKEWGLSVLQASLNDILSSRQLVALRSRLADQDCQECPIHRGQHITQGVRRERVSTNPIHV